jgi:hypothetical protein
MLYFNWKHDGLKLHVLIILPLSENSIRKQMLNFHWKHDGFKLHVLIILPLIP